MAGAVALIRNETLTEQWEGENDSRRQHMGEEKENNEHFRGTRLPVCCIFFPCGSGRNARAALSITPLARRQRSARSITVPPGRSPSEQVPPLHNQPTLDVVEPGVLYQVLCLLVTGLTQC